MSIYEARLAVLRRTVLEFFEQLPSDPMFEVLNRSALSQPFSVEYVQESIVEILNSQQERLIHMLTCEL
jgi:hypothetical protein